MPVANARSFVDQRHVLSGIVILGRAEAQTWPSSLLYLFERTLEHLQQTAKCAGQGSEGAKSKFAGAEFYNADRDRRAIRLRPQRFLKLRRAFGHGTLPLDPEGCDDCLRWEIKLMQIGLGREAQERLERRVSRLAERGADFVRRAGRQRRFTQVSVGAITEMFEAAGCGAELNQRYVTARRPKALGSSKTPHQSHFSRAVRWFDLIARRGPVRTCPWGR